MMRQDLRLEMGPNEFTLQNDRVGFIDDGGDLYKFLTTASVTENVFEQYNLRRAAYF